MYFDFHTHLDFYADSTGILREVAEYRVFNVANAMDPESYRKIEAMAALSSYVIPAFGVHPNRADRWAHRLSGLDAYIDSAPLIGEIGLDFYWEKEVDARDQIRVFEYLVRKAVEQDKYCILHTKGAEEEIFDILEASGATKIVIHWYSGPESMFEAYCDAGYYMTYGVEVRYSDLIQSYLRRTPPERLLSETDNPVGEEWLSGKIGRPHVIRQVIGDMAATLDLAEEEVRRLVEENSLRILDESGVKPPAQPVSLLYNRERDPVA